MAILCMDASKGINLILPANKLCLWTMGTQTAGTWNVTIKDAAGAVLVNQSMGGAQLNPKAGVFRTNSSTNYTITLTSGISNVLYGNYPISKGNKVYSDTWIFQGEDGGDDDFNDVHFSMTWFSSEG